MFIFLNLQSKVQIQVGHGAWACRFTHIESRASRRALAFDMAYAAAVINRDCV
ncbi:hypothetical protein [Mesorhizobium caraganae]|uniref:hypothetical protein n=1 Tax=Mesorhizobium caraganae TaxID=483206 RepID=UPI00177C17DB|nr:hypothetical protein [Mesorhizobium caraganae]